MLCSWELWSFLNYGELLFPSWERPIAKKKKKKKSLEATMVYLEHAMTLFFWCIMFNYLWVRVCHIDRPNGHKALVWTKNVGDLEDKQESAQEI